MSLGNLAVKYLLSSTMYVLHGPSGDQLGGGGVGELPRIRGRFQELLGDNDYWITPWKG